MPDRGSPGEQSNYVAAAPTPIMVQFLDTVCASQYETPGNVLIEVTIGAWTVKLPLSEIYGARDRLRISAGGS